MTNDVDPEAPKRVTKDAPGLLAEDLLKEKEALGTGVAGTAVDIGKDGLGEENGSVSGPALTRMLPSPGSVAIRGPGFRDTGSDFDEEEARETFDNLTDANAETANYDVLLTAEPVSVVRATRVIVDEKDEKPIQQQNERNRTKIGWFGVPPRKLYWFLAIVAAVVVGVAVGVGATVASSGNTPTLSNEQKADETNKYLTFSSKEELITAVDAYFHETSSSSSSNVAHKYGYPIGRWDVSRLNDFSYVFAGRSDLTDEDLSGWDVSNGVNFKAMFKSATGFRDGGDLSGWNVSKGTDFSEMFSGTTSFNGDVSSWRVSSATNFSLMFFNTSSFNGVLVSWDVSKVTDFSGMFYLATSFTGVGLQNWDVSSGVYFRNMFRQAFAFTEDVEDWQVHNGVDFSFMFADSLSFDAKMNQWDMSNAATIESMFQGAMTFDEDLCKWSQTLHSNVIVANVFLGSECPIQSDPILAESGPFCVSCDYQT